MVGDGPEGSPLQKQFLRLGRIERNFHNGNRVVGHVGNSGKGGRGFHALLFPQQDIQKVVIVLALVDAFQMLELTVNAQTHHHVVCHGNACPQSFQNLPDVALLHSGTVKLGGGDRARNGPLDLLKRWDSVSCTHSA